MQDFTGMLYSGIAGTPIYIKWISIYIYVWFHLLNIVSVTFIHIAYSYSEFILTGLCYLQLDQHTIYLPILLGMETGLLPVLGYYK